MYPSFLVLLLVVWYGHFSFFYLFGSIRCKYFDIFSMFFYDKVFIFPRTQRTTPLLLITKNIYALRTTTHKLYFYSLHILTSKAKKKQISSNKQTQKPITYCVYISTPKIFFRVKKKECHSHTPINRSNVTHNIK